LTLTGKPPSQDDVYIYTNEYADSVRFDFSRNTLRDTGGTDTLNAAAVSGASVMDLTPGSSSSIGGTALRIDANASIEHAIGGDGNDRISGNAADNTLRGMRGDDALFGAGGNDVLIGSAGTDTLDGGAGTDTAVFTSTRAQANIVRTPTGFSVSDTLASRDGVDFLMDIERMQFADKIVALDLGSGQSAGNAVRLIGAAFDTDYIPEYSGVGVTLFDAGLDMLDVAQRALNTDLFVTLAGSRDNVDFVNTVYLNVIGVLPSDWVRNHYVGLLQGSGGTMTQAELLVYAANEQVNELNIDLVGLQQSGLEFA
jgi:serralysin